MADRAFRKIDVDIYDEDVLLDSELYDPDPRSADQILSDAKQKQATVRTHLSRGDTLTALSTVLDNAPYGMNVEEAKASPRTFEMWDSDLFIDIPGIVKSLDPELQDTLMKFIYKGMAMPGSNDISASVLLTWHEKLTEVAGTGCIVRVMTDRKTV
ncbi:hypothetical protein Clacol_003599 [Clathrus columnatus]|uniref:Actin-related protein 2/3 complex subunit 5 n=1 Tax=Clathrus columnatus TaxID=1419009 RepID=A0AAV5A462_9AGAM|nr:hypothetical protein Clacol_003599 [Clathrus columnatus]